jgi:hypothetical protein
MTKKTLWAAPLAALIALSAAPQLAGARAPTEPAATAKAPRQCFWTRSANGFAAQGEKIVNIRVGVKDVYQFEMFGPCFDIDWSHRIALISRTGSQICTGMDADIVTPSAIGPQRCHVRSVRKLTPAEVAALPKGAKP